MRNGQRSAVAVIIELHIRPLQAADLTAPQTGQGEMPCVAETIVLDVL
jgi:hypothetical protein